MISSYEFRIYPNIAQAEALSNVFEYCRLLYNAALQERISFYKKFGKSLSYFDQSKHLPEINKSDNLKGKIVAQTLQAVLKTLDTAYQNFFRRVKKGLTPGFPRFKKYNQFKSVLFPQCDLKQRGVKLLENGKLKITGLPGEVKFIKHREILGNIKNVRVKKTPTGKYFILVTCDNIEFKKQEKTGKLAGIDLGLETFITTDDGTKFYHPKPYRTSLEKLRFKSKLLSNSKKDSKNRDKKKLQLARLHEKIVNIKKDFQHKLANKIIKENDIIYLEDLNISKMMSSKEFIKIARSIADASWGTMIEKLTYKAERAGKKVVKVNPANTSKTCSCCGFIKETLELVERVYHCQSCGLTMDRDINAALNIKRLGISLEKDAVRSIPRKLCFSA